MVDTAETCMRKMAHRQTRLARLAKISTLVSTVPTRKLSPLRFVPKPKHRHVQPRMRCAPEMFNAAASCKRRLRIGKSRWAKNILEMY